MVTDGAVDSDGSARAVSSFRQFLRFGMVGAAGFLVDAGTLWTVRRVIDLDLYSARGISYLAAATATWALNRRYTFIAAPRRAALRQWLCFLIVNLGGGAVNYSTYAALIAFTPLAQLPAWLGPTLAVGAGSLAGLAVNFVTSRRWVFK
jgi:putative flippase GtrA